MPAGDDKLSISLLQQCGADPSWPGLITTTSVPHSAQRNRPPGLTADMMHSSPSGDAGRSCLPEPVVAQAPDVSSTTPDSISLSTSPAV
jgi:hypothetical protein